MSAYHDRKITVRFKAEEWEAIYAAAMGQATWRARTVSRWIRIVINGELARLRADKLARDRGGPDADGPKTSDKSTSVLDRIVGHSNGTIPAPRRKK